MGLLRSMSQLWCHKFEWRRSLIRDYLALWLIPGSNHSSSLTSRDPSLRDTGCKEVCTFFCNSRIRRNENSFHSLHKGEPTALRPFLPVEEVQNWDQSIQRDLSYGVHLPSSCSHAYQLTVGTSPKRQLWNSCTFGSCWFNSWPHPVQTTTVSDTNNFFKKLLSQKISV